MRALTFVLLTALLLVAYDLAAKNADTPHYEFFLKKQAEQRAKEGLKPQPKPQKPEKSDFRPERFDWNISSSKNS